MSYYSGPSNTGGSAAKLHQLRRLRPWLLFVRQLLAVLAACSERLLAQFGSAQLGGMRKRLQHAVTQLLDGCPTVKVIDGLRFRHHRPTELRGAPRLAHDVTTVVERPAWRSFEHEV